jgi:hypothetical protein
MSERLLELQARNIKGLATTGIALIVAWPIAWFLVPFGIVIGGALAVFGVMTIARAMAAKAELDKQRAAVLTGCTHTANTAM